MGSDQSKPRPYPTSRRRVRSKDLPPSFNKFMDQYYGHRDRLYEIIMETEKVQASFKDIKDKYRTGVKASCGITGAAAGLGIVGAPFTGGLSLILLGASAATAVAGGTTLIGVTATTFIDRIEARKRINSLTDELQSKLKPLRSKLSTMAESCRELRERSQYSDHTNQKLRELEQSSSSLYDLIEKDNNYENILHQVDNLCSQISLTF